MVELAYPGAPLSVPPASSAAAWKSSTVARSGAVKATCTFSVVGSRWSVIQNHGLPSLPKPPVRGIGSISKEKPSGASARS